MDRLRRDLGRLGGILGRLRMVLEPSWIVFGRLIGLAGLLVGILRRLEGILGRLADLRPCHCCATHVPGGGSAGVSDQDPLRFSSHSKDRRKEIRIRILLGYGILHAMRRHKATALRR